MIIPKRFLAAYIEDRAILAKIIARVTTEQPISCTYTDAWLCNHSCLVCDVRNPVFAHLTHSRGCTLHPFIHSFFSFFFSFFFLVCSATEMIFRWGTFSWFYEPIAWSFFIYSYFNIEYQGSCKIAPCSIITGLVACIVLVAPLPPTPKWPTARYRDAQSTSTWILHIKPTTHYSYIPIFPFSGRKKPPISTLWKLRVIKDYISRKKRKKIAIEDIKSHKLLHLTVAGCHFSIRFCQFCIVLHRFQNDFPDICFFFLLLLCCCRNYNIKMVN